MLYWIPALAWMAIIFYLSGRTAGQLQSMFPFIGDFNPGHIIAYFFLALFYYGALHKNNQPRPYLKSFLLCQGYGITDELHQYFVPGRVPDIYDLGRDLFGATMALVLIYKLKLLQENKG